MLCPFVSVVNSSASQNKLKYALDFSASARMMRMQIRFGHGNLQEGDGKCLAVIANKSRSQNGEFVGRGLFHIHAGRHRSRHVTITCLIPIEQGLHSFTGNMRVAVGSIYTNGSRGLLYLEPGMGRGSMKLSTSILRASRHPPVIAPSTLRLHRRYKTRQRSIFREFNR